MSKHFSSEAERICSVITEEEILFKRTLDRGEVRLSRIFARLREKGVTILPGYEAFRMHDTFGYPIEITRDAAAEAGFAVDEDGFEAAMSEQRARGRQARIEKMRRGKGRKK